MVLTRLLSSGNVWNMRADLCTQLQYGSEIITPARHGAAWAAHFIRHALLERWRVSHHHLHGGRRHPRLLQDVYRSIEQTSEESRGVGWRLVSIKHGGQLQGSLYGDILTTAPPPRDLPGLKEQNLSEQRTPPTRLMTLLLTPRRLKAEMCSG